MTDLADRIRERLSLLKKSAAAASLEAGLGRSAIQDILAGNSTSPRLDTLEKLTGPLQCSISYLVGGSPDPEDEPFVDLNEIAISGVIASGTFKKGRTRFLRDEIRPPENERIYPVSHDPRLPDWSIELYKMEDDSLTGRDIQKGDVLYVASPSVVMVSQQIDLFPDQIVVFEHTLHPIGLTEVGARVVEQSGEGFKLSPASQSEYDVFEIGGATMGSENAYSVEDGWIRIKGIVVGMYRELAFD